MWNGSFRPVTTQPNGAFDIAIYPVMKAWGFTDDNFRVPEEEELQELLTLFKAKGAGKNIKVKKM